MFEQKQTCMNVADSEFSACRSLFKNSESAEKNAEAVLKWCRDRGVGILFPGHPDYPFEDGQFENPPRFVSYIGTPVWKERASIAVVGSREPTRIATVWMETHFTEFLRKTNALTVSGGARGIDFMAHSLSIRAKSPTIVFMPSGLDRLYPDDWNEWKDRVLNSGGAIVSTYSPFQDIRRSHFQERNRWIAAMARLVFVVEARRQSGSSMTARIAREIDRTVCCLPGPPGDSRCAGNVDLLFDGALAIRDASDLQVLFDVCTFRGDAFINPKRDEG